MRRDICQINYQLSSGSKLSKEFNMDFLSVGLDFKGARQNFLDTSTNTSKMSTFAMDALTDEKGI